MIISGIFGIERHGARHRGNIPVVVRGHRYRPLALGIRYLGQSADADLFSHIEVFFAGDGVRQLPQQERAFQARWKLRSTILHWRLIGRTIFIDICLQY